MQAVDAIRSGRIPAQTYMRTLIARAEQMKHLNAFITLNADGALAAAQKIDAMVAAGQPLPPLAGLPIVVKDNINTADMPTTGGTEALRHARPKANAPSLQTLIDAGAIVIGKTNLHELAFGITSTNARLVRGPCEEPARHARAFPAARRAAPRPRSPPASCRPGSAATPAARPGFPRR